MGGIQPVNNSGDPYINSDQIYVLTLRSIEMLDKMKEGSLRKDSGEELKFKKITKEQLKNTKRIDKFQRENRIVILGKDNVFYLHENYAPQKTGRQAFHIKIPKGEIKEMKANIQGLSEEKYRVVKNAVNSLRSALTSIHQLKPEKKKEKEHDMLVTKEKDLETASTSQKVGQAPKIRDKTPIEADTSSRLEERHKEQKMVEEGKEQAKETIRESKQVFIKERILDAEVKKYRSP